MHYDAQSYGRAWLTKEERKTLSRAEKKSLRQERKDQVKAQARPERRTMLEALKSGGATYGPQPGGLAITDPSIVFDPGASGADANLVPGVPNWALAVGAVVVTAGAVGGVVYMSRR